jgi:hypothetical protein
MAASAEWMRARGKERREAIWFRDADVAEAIDAALFVGMADWYPPNYDCGACGTPPARREAACSGRHRYVRTQYGRRLQGAFADRRRRSA